MIIVSWLLCSLIIATISVILGRKYGNWVLYAVFAMLVLVSNLAGSKLIKIGPATVPAVVAIYAVTFLCTDATCELYGKEESKRLVFGGFIANALAIPLIYLVVAWPSQARFAEEFNLVFGLVPRIIIASLIAYIISQTHDIHVYLWYKRKTEGKYMWLRNNASTIVSQLIDSCLFITIAFIGVHPTSMVLSMIVYQWLVKIGIAILDTPFLYLTVGAAGWVVPEPKPCSSV